MVSNRFAFYVLVSAAVCLALQTSAKELPTSLPALVAALDEAISETQRDYPERMRLVDHADRWLLANTDTPTSVSQKVRYLEALTNMRLGKFELSAEQAGSLCNQIAPEESPDLRMRCDVLAASLLTIQGNRAASLAAFEAIFSADLSRVSDHLISRFRLTYAVVLNENGRSEQAVDIYEEILLQAIFEVNDELTLLAGNNLIVILITQQDYAAAQQTLKKLGPARNRNPDSLVYGSLLLHEYELMRLGGEVDDAIENFRGYIGSNIDNTPLMLGSAHRLLADALIERGDLNEAQIAAERSIALLDGQAHELTDAQLTLARVAIGKEDFEGAVSILEGIDMRKELVPTRRVLIHRYLLEAKLRLKNMGSEISSFESLIADDEERDRLASTTRAEYLDAQIRAVQKGRDLERAEAKVLAQQRDSKNDRLLMLLIAGAAIAVCFLIYASVSRRAERERMREQEQHAERLGALVAERTEELRASLVVQAEITEALERKKRVEAVGALAGNVAHDFNNLLQVIAGSKETLARANESEKDKASALTLLDNSVRHAARIVRQLLAYSRQQNLDAAPQVFGLFLKENQELFRSALGDQNQLKIADRSEGTKILVDSAQLTTSILNLIRNSADAMPGGGVLTIEASVVRLERGAHSQWKETAPGEYLSIIVSDTGMGIREEELGRAVEPFFTTKDPRSGTGLGLSSVQGFVKQSGGDLRISSAVGQGTSVEILLPTTDQDAPEEAVSIGMATRGLNGCRLLLVEDNQSVASILVALLHKLDLNVVLVDSGEQAKSRLLEDSRFDILLSDVRMPGQISGSALARWVTEEYPNITPLLMSGFADVPANEQGVPLLRKPFTLPQLAAFLQRHLRRDLGQPLKSRAQTTEQPQ